MKTSASIIENSSFRTIREDGRVRATMYHKPNPRNKTGGAKRRDWSYRANTKPSPCTVTTF